MSDIIFHMQIQVLVATQHFLKKKKKRWIVMLTGAEMDCTHRLMLIQRKTYLLAIPFFCMQEQCLSYFSE